MQRQVGKFYISAGIIESEPTLARMVLSQVVVVRCEMLWGSGSFEYVAIGPCFDPVPENEIVPVYTVTIHDGRDELRPDRITFTRLTGNGLS